MIRSCSMYAIRQGDVLNIPFVAFNDDQANEIVVGAFDGEIPFDFELVKIGVFDFYNGISGLDFEVVRVFRAGDIEGGCDDEISPSV